MNTPSNLRPDLFITAADGTVCPAYNVRERVTEGVYRVETYAHHPTAGAVAISAARVAELRAEGRVSAEAAPVAEAPARAPRRAVSVLPAKSTAARLANAARAVAMRAAHAVARSGDASTLYADRLGAALRAIVRNLPGPTRRRCSLATLRAQAAEFVAVCEASGARFDVVQKACDALRFSAEANARGFCLPSKLTGVSAYQDAAAAVGSRLDSRGGWVLCDRDDANGDGSGVYTLGMRLGAVQAKHARTWLPALGAVRVAVTAVTGGRAIVTPDGRAVTTTRGVNVAVEVWPALARRIGERAAEARVEALRAGRLVEAGPGIFVSPASAARITAEVQRAGGHAVAWGRLD